mmetsp:Transcript_169094/g.543482  ORF Transcript_169094/g.543482 Transcript_169094/m.543482 type:complete len:340 (-) Transcript_169094:1281-2300(-)
MSGLQVRLGQCLVRTTGQPAIDGESETQLAGLAGVTADQSAARFAQRRGRTGHQLHDVLLLLLLRREGHLDQRQHRLRDGTHGLAVAECVHRGDAAEHVGVADEAPEEVDRLHRSQRSSVVALSPQLHHGRVVAHAHDDLRLRGLARLLRRIHPRHGLAQRGRTHLGSTTTAPHRGVPQQIQSTPTRGLSDGRAGAHSVGGFGHIWEAFVIVPHPPPINPVLQVPQPLALHGERAPGGDAGAVPQAEEAQKRALRPIGHHFVAHQRRPDVDPQHHARHDREDPGLRPGKTIDRGDVAAREDVAAVAPEGGQDAAAQLLVDEQEAVVVRLQAALTNPTLG